MGKRIYYRCKCGRLIIRKVYATFLLQRASTHRLLKNSMSEVSSTTLVWQL